MPLDRAEAVPEYLTQKPAFSGRRRAVLDGRTPAETTEIDLWLERHPATEVARFAVKDEHDLNDALKRGDYPSVLFASIDALIDMILSGHADTDEWIQRGIRIDFAAPLAVDETALRILLAQFSSSHARWRQRMRRKQIVAATILSLLALVALWLLFTMMPTRP